MNKPRYKLVTEFVLNVLYMHKVIEYLNERHKHVKPILP